MIDLEHVSKEYKRGGPLALDDINLHVDDGEFVFLLGHSGAGKSTLLKLLLREELPSEGKVTVLGKDVASLHRHQVPYLRRQMGIIFQDFRLIPTMTVYENIAFAMHVTNVKRREISDRVEYMLELVHLEDKANVYPEFLSGGEQQMLAMGRALMSKPKLLMLDEPSMGLAPILVEQIFDIIRELHAAGTTILLVEQNAKKALSISDRAYVLETGAITAEGTAQDLLNNEEIVKAYLGG